MSAADLGLDATPDARSGDGDLLVVSDGPLAPQPLILSATEGLPAGGGWETASYTCVVPAQEGCACAAAPASAGRDKLAV